jgi:hypothetical protein
MSFTYIITTKSSAGGSESLSTDLPKRVLLIGRGSDCDIALRSKTVSLRHAELTLDEQDVLTIRDLGSLTGIKVNSQTATAAKLQEGDTFHIGETKFTVGRSDKSIILTEERSDVPPVAREDRVQAALSVYNRFKDLPYLQELGMLLAAFLFIATLVSPLGSDNQPSWSSGPLANVHQTFGHSCVSCHAEPFQPITDTSCMDCHSMSDHTPEGTLPTLRGIVQTLQATKISGGNSSPHSSAALKDHPEGRCATCHIDHNGDEGLVNTHPKLCTDCHGAIKKQFNDATSLPVTSWEDHPELSATILSRNSTNSATELSYVALDGKTTPQDPTPLKFNHKVHLQGPLKSDSGDRSLSCTDCHQIQPRTEGLLTPVTYEKSCKSCHPLTYDERLPKLVLPHGRPDDVYKVLLSSYIGVAEEIHSKKNSPLAQQFSFKSIPGRARSVVAESQQQFAQEEARNVEKLLFPKTTCGTCHMVEKNTTPVDALSSRYTVASPLIPTNWMSRARFNHAKHQFKDCNTCHEGVSQSSETTDVLLPAKKSCNECHASDRALGKVKSDCIMCHSFHDEVYGMKKKSAK